MEVGGGDGGQPEPRARGVLEVRAEVGEIDEGHVVGVWPQWAQIGGYQVSGRELICFRGCEMGIRIYL